MPLTDEQKSALLDRQARQELSDAKRMQSDRRNGENNSEARVRLMQEFSGLGWKLRTRAKSGRQEPLKFPRASHPTEAFELQFRHRAIHVALEGWADTCSLVEDMRGKVARELVAPAEILAREHEQRLQTHSRRTEVEAHAYLRERELMNSLLGNETDPARILLPCLRLAEDEVRKGLLGDDGPLGDEEIPF